jgi:hypothetical protein
MCVSLDDDDALMMMVIMVMVPMEVMVMWS